MDMADYKVGFLNIYKITIINIIKCFIIIILSFMFSRQQ